jgi:anti-anti-sigma regulatory factor
MMTTAGPVRRAMENKSAMEIYVSKNGQRYGPYSVEELRKEVQANVFRPEHFASVDHGQTWRPIDAIPELGSLVYEVTVEPERQLLVIRYRGYVRAPAVARCAQEVRSALVNLNAGFRVLVDLSELERMETDCATEVKNIMRLCRERGVKTVVRVIPDPQRDIGLGILSYFHYGPEVQITTCRILQEAQDLLRREEREETP